MNYVPRLSRFFSSFTLSRSLGVPVGLVLAAAVALPAPAQAAEPSHWSIDSQAVPTNFSAASAANCALGEDYGVCNTYQIILTDSSSQPTNGGAVTIADTLPPGLTAQGAVLTWSGNPAGHESPLSASCAGVPFECTIPSSVFTQANRTIRPGDAIHMRLYVSVDEPEPALPTDLSNVVTVKGGGLEPASATSHNTLAGVPAPFGFASFSSPALGSNGTPETQAGGHPYDLPTQIDPNTAVRDIPENSTLEAAIDSEDFRDILVDLPPGLAGSALSTPKTCTLAQLSGTSILGTGSGSTECPSESAIGKIRTYPEGDLTGVISNLYNMLPEHGVAAEFGYNDNLNASHVLYASIVPTPAGYVLRTTSPEIPQVNLTAISVNVFGDPAATDAGRAQQAADVPTFTSPADCNGEPLKTQIHADSWQHPGTYNAAGEPNLSEPNWVTATSEAEHVSGCNKLKFEPKITATPETNRADSPTGLEVDLKVPQNEGVGTLATPPLRKAVVTLPEGMTVNPSSANGLQGCSLADLGMSPTGQPNAAPPNCPNASKIGTVELQTPALPGVLEGEIFVAKQTENPFHSLLALYIVVNDPKTGVIVKLPGEIKANPETGQLTTVVDNSPQFPFSELRTHFFGGTKAALRTPSVCGTYKVTSTLTPWSAPESGPPATPTATFKITQGCAESAASEPNAPAFSAGTLTPTADLYSPFVLHLKREDGSQELKGLDVALPLGLIGKLAGIQECPEADIAAAKAREHEGGGVQEIASPSCPASSEVGQVTVGAGAGLTPYYATGHVYLAGPYKGAPLSLAIITPAVAGPYDLGAVVVRNALVVNPETTQITAVSDEIPHILDGLPLDIRSIALQMSRHEFTLNPTSCEKKSVTGSATSVLGQSAALTNPFQVGGCKGLGFKPDLKLSLKGGTKRAGHPALKAVLTYPPKGSYANIANAQVTLPHSEFLDQGHLNNICTKVVFAEGAHLGEKCPAASVYGFAKAETPLLEAPVEGPVYLRSPLPGHKLPDLVAALNGQIDVALVGKVDTGKGGGIRNTFEIVPDAPVTRFTLTLQGAGKGLLENSENICSHPQKAIVDFTAQNGKVDDSNPLIANSCKVKHHKKKHRGRH